MSTWQPGPGDPSQQPGQGWTPPPQPPRKPEPRKVWWLLPIVLFVAALGVGIGGIVLGASSFAGTEASAPIDGQPHEVTLESAEPKTVWLPDGTSGRCRFTDESGADIALDPMTGEATRSFGNGPYRAQYTFDPAGTSITVACQAEGAAIDRDVEIGPEVEVGKTVGGILGGILAGGFLLLLAVVSAIVIAVKTASGAPRAES